MITETIKIDTSQSTKSVKELRKELRDLKDQLLSTEQGTEEYNATLMKAAGIQKDLKDQMLAVNNTAQDFGQVVGNVTGVLAGMSGAVTAVTGALSLFGIQNDEAAKKITATMTSLIGLTQGLSRIDSGIKAFKRLTIAIQGVTGATSAFSKALISTGLGAIIVAVGLLAANWDRVREAILSVIPAGKKMLEQEKEIAATEDNIKKIKESTASSEDYSLRLLRAQGAEEKEILGLQIKNQKIEIQRLKSVRDRLGLIFQEKQEFLENSSFWYDVFGIAENKAIKARDDAAKALSDASKAITDAEKNLEILETQLDTVNSKSNIKITATTDSSDKEDKTVDNQIEAIKKRLQAYEDSQKTELALLEERYAEEKKLFEDNQEDITELTKEYESERAKIVQDTAIKTTNETLDLIEQTAEQKKIGVEFDLKMNNLDAKDVIEQIDNEKNAINTIFDIEKSAIQEKIDALNGLLAQLEPGTEEFINAQNEITNATIELQNLETQNYIDNMELQKKKDEEVAESRKKKAQSTVDAMNSIASILGAVSDAMEDQVQQELKNGKISDQEYQRKMKAVKGMQIAMVTIQMLTGIATALAGTFTTKTGVWDIALAAAQAASIAASGIASIVKIKQTQPDEATGSASSYVPSISIPSVVTSSGDFTQSVDGALTQTAIQDQRVYVLEHDITETQKKVQVAESRATY